MSKLKNQKADVMNDKTETVKDVTTHGTRGGWELSTLPNGAFVYVLRRGK
jgi:hypothetical protein